MGIFVGVAVHHCLHLTLSQVCGGWVHFLMQMICRRCTRSQFSSDQQRRVTNVLGLAALHWAVTNEERMECIGLQSTNQFGLYVVMCI